MTLLPILKRIQRPIQHKVILVTQSFKIVEKSKHIGIITFKGSTNLGLGVSTEDANICGVISVHARRILSFMSS